MEAQGNEFISWKIFMQDLTKGFDKNGLEDPLVELTNLKQIGDLHDYI